MGIAICIESNTTGSCRIEAYKDYPADVLARFESYEAAVTAFTSVKETHEPQGYADFYIALDDDLDGLDIPEVSLTVSTWGRMLELFASACTQPGTSKEARALVTTYALKRPLTAIAAAMPGDAFHLMVTTAFRRCQCGPPEESEQLRRLALLVEIGRIATELDRRVLWS